MSHIITFFKPLETSSLVIAIPAEPAPGILTEEMVAKMAKDPIVFAMANPVP